MDNCLYRSMTEKREIIEMKIDQVCSPEISMKEVNKDKPRITLINFTSLMRVIKENQTEIHEFYLLGFQNLPIFNYVLFALFLEIYTLTVTSNLLIIILVAMAPSLRTPMYFLLAQLSLTDIFITTNIVPNMLHVLINGGKTISITCCIAQLGIHCVLTGMECLLLTVMSYDRYVAICDPLRYFSIINIRLCLHMVISSGFLVTIISSLIVFLISKLRFCGPDTFDHYFCDFGPFLELSCSEPAFVVMVNIVDLIIAIPFVVLPFMFIVFTYISIFITIFGISSTTGRQKAFSTCSSHLNVVSLYYGTLIMVYMAPSKGHSLNFNKLLSLLYTTGIPCLNPIIYSLRNQEIKKAFVRWTLSFSRCK